MCSLKRKIEELESENDLLRQRPAIIEQTMTPKRISSQTKVYSPQKFAYQCIFHDMSLTLYGIQDYDNGHQMEEEPKVTIVL